MTKKELLKLLDVYDDDAEVFIFDNDRQRDVPIVGAYGYNSEMYFDKEKYPRKQITLEANRGF